MSRPPGPRLISAPWVLPMSRPPLREGAVLVDGKGTIVAVGPRRELKGPKADAPETRAYGALMPGLINAHTHLELSAARGQVPAGTSFIDWATALMRALTGLSSEKKQDASRDAAKQARDTGTVAVGDVSNTLDAVAAIGHAGLCGQVFHELVGSREARTGDALADAAREYRDFTAREPWPTGLAYSVAPHAAFSVGPDLLRRIFATAAATGRATTIHVAEDPDELALLRDGSGRWAPLLTAMGVATGSRTPGQLPVAYLASLGAFAGPRAPLLVHMVHATAADIALAAEHGAPVVLCPRSNLHVGGRLADVAALQKAGVPLALGTDSLASTPSLSLWGEIATLAKHFPTVDPQVWLTAATTGGAAALDLPALGGLAPGKRPGLIDVSLDNINAPLESLIASASPTVRKMVSA